MGNYANHAVQEVFSQFWQQHQKDLRYTLKVAHMQARQSSERVDLSTIRAELQDQDSRIAPVGSPTKERQG